MRGKRVYLENIDVKSIRLLIPGEYGKLQTEYGGFVLLTDCIQR